MAALTELELPEFEFMDTTLRGERFHATMADLAARSWLAKAELGYFVLNTLGRRVAELSEKLRGRKDNGLTILARARKRA